MHELAVVFIYSEYAIMADLDTDLYLRTVANYYLWLHVYT